MLSHRPETTVREKTREAARTARRSVPLRHATWLLLTLAVGCGRVEPPEPRPLRSGTVMVAAWGHTIAEDDTVALGLDLDGRMDDGAGRDCTNALDLISPITGEAGVDNQFAARLLGLLEPFGPFPLWGPEAPHGDELSEEIFREQLVRGVALVGFDVRLTSRPGEPEEASVTVLALEPVDGLVDDGFRLAPGNRARATALETTTVELARRRARFHLASLRVPLGLLAGVREIHDVTVELHFDRDGDPDHAEIGGAMSIVDLGDIVAARFELAPDPAELDEPTREIVAPDLEPDASGVCQAASFGASVGLVPVILER